MVRLEGSGRLFIAPNGLVLRFVLLGPCRARNLQVLQGLEVLERHLRRVVSLLEGYWGLRRVWVACAHLVHAVAIEIDRGCPVSDKHAKSNKVSLNGLTVALFRVDA